MFQVVGVELQVAGVKRPRSVRSINCNIFDVCCVFALIVLQSVAVESVLSERMQCSA